MSRLSSPSVMVLALFFFSTEARAGFAHVQGASASAASGTTLSVVFASNPALGHLVACGAMFYDGSAGGTTATMKDFNNNNYTQSTHSPGNVFNASAGQAMAFYLLNAPANADKTITITYAATMAAAALFCDEFAVTGGTAVYDTDILGSGTGTAVNSPTITPTGSGELGYAIATDAFGISSANAPWSTGVAAQDGCLSGYDLNISSATAVNFTADAAVDWASIVMAFRIPPPIKPRKYLISQ